MSLSSVARRVLPGAGVVVALAGMGAGAAEAGGYNFVTIDLPSGASAPSVDGVNRAGEVVGSYVDAHRQQRGFIWSAGGLTSFTGPDPTGYTYPGAINGHGVVVGAAEVGGARDRGFLRATSGDEMRLAIPHDLNVTMTGLNAAGEAVGYGATPHQPGARVAFTIAGGAWQRIGPHGAYSAQAEAIDNAGDVAGVFTYPTSRLNKGFVYRDGSYRIFQAPNGFFEHVAINAAGMVSGSYLSGKNYVLHGFTWAAHVFTTVDYPGATQTSVTQTLTDGTLVGTWRDGNFVAHGFVQAGGVFHSVEAPGAVSTSVDAASDDGTLAGVYQDGAGTARVFAAVCAAGQAPCTQ